MKILKKAKFWFVDVSRGYSAPMSILNWAVIFALCVKLHGNVFNGILGLVGLLCAHLGANVYDDYVDYISDVPKQECKTRYLTEGLTDAPTIRKLAFLYFGIAAAIGLFFMFKCGLGVLVPAIAGGIICVIYPKMNYYCLGELTLGAAFGPLMFAGMSYVMLGYFSMDFILISIPVALFTLALLIAHALMDYDFDVSCNKKTFCTTLGSKNNALAGLFTLILGGYIITLTLILVGKLPLTALYTLLTVPTALNLRNSLKQYNEATDETQRDFMKNFRLARNLSVFFNLILLLAIIFA